MSKSCFSPGSSDSTRLQIPQKMQQDEGERASTSSPVDGNWDSTADVDPTARRSVGNASQWGKPVPKVPPSWMTSLYFSGRQEQLRLKPSAGVELPRDKFSLELWVNPEGGQSSPAVIAGVYDNCSRSQSEKGWSVGIRSLDPAGTKDARFYFTLRTDRALKATTVVTHQQYSANTWAHLVATYNSHNMTLYVDGAKVCGFGMASDCNSFTSVFDITFKSETKKLKSFFQGQGFRVGMLLKTSAVYASTSPVVIRHLRGLLQPIAVSMPFPSCLKVDQMWTPFKDGFHPAVIATPLPALQLVSPFLPPPCGLTPCDNTDIISGYNNYWPLRTPKQVRYRIINLSDDDGGNATVSQDQIRLQHRALIDAFRPYNITLELTVDPVRNTSLRQRFVLSNCRIGKIGNRHCDPECDHPRTGHDGGDCLRLGPCYNWKRQNGVCNTECNSVHYDYDDGDCCDPQVTDVLKTCFDPESPDRAYMSVKELKEELHLSGTDTLNVFFASNSAREELAGAATWPWAKEALTHQGGMVLNPSYFGTSGHHNTMIHELGHIFGLYHVFKGVSERDSCDDPCQETTPSMETGDLCADTAPTPKSKACHDPGAVNDTCGVSMYQDTPYSNYMSYTDDNCTDHFTPNQVARMHCYLDLVYPNWLLERLPVTVPLPAMVTDQSPDSVSIYWLAPLTGPLCARECEKDGVLHQYAYEAASPRKCDTSGYWAPDEAIGPPDVEQPCEPSLQAWSPDLSLYDTNVTSPCPETEGCTLTLKFRYPIVPNTLTLWITYVSTNNPAIADIQLITDSGKTIHLGPQHVFCDMLFTLRLDTNNVAISAVKLCTFDEKMEIDAAMLSSGPGSHLCSGCQPFLYRVHRRPPFTGKLPTVRRGERYEYMIQVEIDGLLSNSSPSLFYTHGQPYCGDGVIQGYAYEECDDGNLLDGDGCSKKCHKEKGFNCIGKPSQCYVFDGDGVCEEFERVSSIQDCGYFTPLGYTDQWASTATASHQEPDRCPAHAATGEPSYKKVGFVHSGVASSVIVYLASDGSWSGEHCQRSATILLSDTMGKNHSLGTHSLSCHRNPLVVNVTHDLSQPFFLTSSVILLFSSSSVAIGGVALRTSCHFSTFAVTGCASEGGLSHNDPRAPHHLTIQISSYLASHHFASNFHYYDGFQYQGKTSMTEMECFHGLWNRAVSCQPVDCGPPDQAHVYHAIFSCPRGTTYGKQCSFTCGSPAILQGDNDRLVCLEDGLWSFPEAYCKIECPEVPKVPNAELLTAECLSSSHDVGSTCRFKCNPGFYPAKGLSDISVAFRKYFKSECLEEGQWEEASCEPIACPAFPDVFQGMYRCTNGLFYDTVCTLRCPDASENVSETLSAIRCTKDGEWTAQFTMCSGLQGSCSPPTDQNSVAYSCDGAGGVNNSVPKLPSSQCYGLTHINWEDVLSLITCSQPFGGDGWCDTLNNRAYCQYDGGDCCPSTLSSRKVIQFGADCNQDECTCRDPDAKENKSKAKDPKGGGRLP
uniref:Pappalysin 2 n=1 Tax=Hippocampus comes TaxID=109280 RepID=A0A3Q2YZ81_HIPCM